MDTTTLRIICGVIVVLFAAVMFMRRRSSKAD
jgi:hypothetical protein